MLETRNKQINEIVFGQSEEIPERNLFLYIYQGDQDSGVEKIIKVSNEISQR